VDKARAESSGLSHEKGEWGGNPSVWIGMFIGGVEVDPRDNKHDRLYREFVDRK
jgi:hypothetical protein